MLSLSSWYIIIIFIIIIIFYYFSCFFRPNGGPGRSPAGLFSSPAWASRQACCSPPRSSLLPVWPTRPAWPASAHCPAREASLPFSPAHATRCLSSPVCAAWPQAACAASFLSRVQRERQVSLPDSSSSRVGPSPCGMALHFIRPALPFFSPAQGDVKTQDP